MKRYPGAILFYAAVTILIAAGCGDEGPTELEPDDSAFQEKWYPVAEGRSWTYVAFDSAGTPVDTSTVVIEDVAKVGDALRVSWCWDGETNCPEQVVSSSQVLSRLADPPLTIYRFPMQEGDRWIWAEESRVVGPDAELLGFTRGEAVVAGVVDVELRTDLSFVGTIRTDFLELSWPELGASIDTTLVFSTFLAENIGCAKVIYHPYVTPWGPPSSLTTFELLKHSAP